MAKKTTKDKMMPMVREATAEKGGKDVKGVRLDLSLADHERLARRAKEKGLTMSSYARMALFDRLRADETGAK